jgi:enoyl-CoA hydratase
MTSPTASDLLLRHDDQGVTTLTIHRPDKLNALNAAVLSELDASFTALAADSSVRAIVLTGTGSKAFVAGADIAEIQALSATEAHQFASRGQALMQRIQRLNKPVIAAINGFALGGGLELALACHLRVASEQAKLGLPEIKLGIMPGFGGTQRLVRLVGSGRALEMTLNGEPVSAQQAHAWGVVNQVWPADQVLSQAQQWAATLAKAAPESVRGILEAILQGGDQSLEAGLALETARFALCCATEDMQEGTRAFLDKRPAQFSGR